MAKESTLQKMNQNKIVFRCYTSFHDPYVLNCDSCSHCSENPYTKEYNLRRNSLDSHIKSKRHMNSVAIYKEFLRERDKERAFNKMVDEAVKMKS
jgi:hypothetical protein